MTELLHEFPTLRHAGRLLYGGDQTLSADRSMRACGCGVVACQDLLIYLCRFHGCHADRMSALARPGLIDHDDYDRCSLELKRRYLPLIPRHGINGVTLALGLNRIFRRNGMPYRAHWGVGSGKLWTTIEAMLRDDLPVILSIGPNFPLFWQHNTLTFYGKKADGRLVPLSRARAHYVSVTGIDAVWLRISSWGREYYISRREYEEYVKAHSMLLVSNILVVERTK